jgi:carbon monoxide dehydrogenase subunit G
VRVQLSDQFCVAAEPSETFAFLTEPRLFAPLLPYFKELKNVLPGAFTVGLEVGIPQLRGRVDVDVKLIECVAPQHALYRSSGRHALGMIDSELSFSVAAKGEGAAVTWQSSSVVSGTLASLAQGMLVPLAARQIKLLVNACQERLGAAS